MKRITVLLAAMLLALAMMSPAWSGGSSDRQSSGVFWLSDGTQVEGADARLTRTDSGVSYNLRITGLMKGHAVSIWWVIFNNPDACDGDCGEADLFEPAVNAAVMSGGGNVVGGSGRSSFAAHLNEGEITNEHPAFQDASGLMKPRMAEIHIVVRSHGRRSKSTCPHSSRRSGPAARTSSRPAPCPKAKATAPTCSSPRSSRPTGAARENGCGFNGWLQQPRRTSLMVSCTEASCEAAG